MTPTIETARLRLRPPLRRDAPAIAAALGQWDVARMLARPPFPYRLTDAEIWLDGLATPDGDGGVFAIERAGGLIGVVTLNPSEDAAHLGYWLAPAAQGQGVMTEAAGAALAWAFETWPIDQATSGVFVDNAASASIHAKLGFEETGRRAVRSRARGVDVEHIDLAIERRRWEALARASWTSFQIETPRLRITPLWADDAPALVVGANDPAVARMLSSVPHPFSLPEAERRIARSAYAARPGFRAAVRRREDGVLVGELALGPEEAASVGYWIGRAHWGRGYAGEAVAAFLEWSAAQFALPWIDADVYLDNPASIRLLERAGFEPVSERIDRCSQVRSEPAPIRLYRRRFA